MCRPPIPGLKDINSPADIHAVIANPKARIALCEQKQRLRVLYSRAVMDNSRAAEAVLLARGTSDFYRVRALADEARRALNSARSALEEHKQEHRC
jgi:hypothetical protein